MLRRRARHRHPHRAPLTGWPHGRNRDGGIDAVPVPAGTLWLCGKHAIAPEPDATLARLGAGHVVCLNERHELADRYPEYVEWLARERGDRATWFPVPDLHAPLPAEMEQLTDDVVARLRGGAGIVVHCGAGIGRAGTLAVAVLLRFGSPLDAALTTVATHRPGAGPEVGEQRRLVETLATTWA